MRITRARLIVQAFFLGLFLFLAYMTSFGRMRGYRVSLFLELDPLVAIGTALSTHSIYRDLVWGLLVAVATLLLGRFFCGWVCPFGTLLHLTGWLFGPRTTEQRIERNRYRPVNGLKYALLAAFIMAAAAGTLQLGLLDPMALLLRSLTTAVWPALNQQRPWMFAHPPIFHLGWFIGGMLLLLLAINLAAPRFFCRALCPLGAALGVLSRFSLWRIDRDPDKCVDCDLCLQGCEGASDPHTHLRKAECFACMNCLDDCPYDALSFRFLPRIDREITHADVGRRRIVVGSIAGFVFAPLARLGGNTTKTADKAVIRPPGSRAEAEFLERCTKCEQCLRVCPTNVLQPALFQAGVEGLWTPILDNRVGYCELNCVLCGQVCETGAIRRISLEEKLGLAAYDGRPIRLGTAFFDRGRCLPWAMETPCVVCEEVCPTSPKAIFTRTVDIVARDGRPASLRLPYVDAARCIGCGICEHECPVKDAAGVRVSAIGETRAVDRSLLLAQE